MPDRPVLGIVGAGKVGWPLARLLYDARYRVAAVYSPTAAHAETLAAQAGAVVTAAPRDVLVQADLTFLTVPDDVIGPLAASLAGGNLTGKGVVHTSGVHEAGVLEVLAAQGAMIGSLHPAYPFADAEIVPGGLAGTTFALEAEDERLVVWLGDIVDALGGNILRLPSGSKALYHAALVFASNYTVTLYAVAESLLLSLSDDRAAIDGALTRLVEVTTANLRDAGIPEALTGPLVRGDAGTLAAHLDALNQHDRALAEVYRTLARLSLPMLAARGVSTREIERVLDGV